MALQTFCDGKVRDMTSEEEADHLALQARIRADQRPPQKSRERCLIDALIAKGVITEDDLK